MHDTRVRIVHAQAAPTLRLALGFLAAAAAAVPLRGSTGAWLPLHLFLAGTVVLAISGATVLLTVTWSSAPAPAGALVRAQRWAIAAGAAGIALGRAADLPAGVVAAAGVAFVAGLAGLAALLVTTVRRGAVRRFDVPVAWYCAAVGAGVVAAGLGVAMATGHGGGVRDAHVTLNLLGLVGLVVGGTFPFFVATVGRTKPAARMTPRRHRTVLGWQAGALVLAATGSTALGLGAYALGVVGLLVLSAVPSVKALRWAGPRLAALYLGVAWWAAAVLACAVTGLAGRGLLALVVAGYGQILWGSLAYLGPMLRGGGHERLRAGFATTRSWVALGALQAAGVLFLTGHTGAATAAAALVVLDTLARNLALGAST